MEKEQKITILVNNGFRPCQVDDFPSNCERSVVGSLHFKPGTMEITKDELKHLRKYHKNINRKLSVIWPIPITRKPVLPPNLELKNKLRELNKLKEMEELKEEVKDEVKEILEKPSGVKEY